MQIFWYPLSSPDLLLNNYSNGLVCHFDHNQKLTLLTLYIPFIILYVSIKSLLILRTRKCHDNWYKFTRNWGLWVHVVIPLSERTRPNPTSEMTQCNTSSGVFLLLVLRLQIYHCVQLNPVLLSSNNVKVSCHKHSVVVSRHQQTPLLTSD